MPEGPIFAKGWLKYTTFEINEKSRPNEFFKNFAFYEQFKSGEILDLNKKDIVGYVNVPDEDHFFFVLTANTLNVLSSRKNKYAKTIDILNLEEVLMQPSTCKFDGGVIDHGDFLEGYCFKVKSFNKKSNKANIWEVCADTKNDKIFWMNVIARLKLSSNTLEKTVSKILEENNVKKIMNNMMKDISKSKEIKDKIKDTQQKAKTPTWIAISTWSTCSKPCGGGKSYLQRLCILPKENKNSEICKGENLISKDCNLQACKAEKVIDKKNYNNTSSPIYKLMPVSKRPLRYEKMRY